MHTEVCGRLGIEFPIFAFSHCRDVVAAVTNAGGFGVLGATGHSPRALEVDLTWIDEQVQGSPRNQSSSPRNQRRPGNPSPASRLPDRASRPLTRPSLPTS